jgi:hypothetical protein
MKLPLLTIISAAMLLILGSMAPNASKKLRFDGMYMTELKIEDGDSTRSYLRFFSPDVVCSVHSGPYPEEIRNWFVPDSMVKAYKGTYKIVKKQLTFKIGLPGKDVEYSGSINGNNLLLHWKSNINGKEGDRKYKFYRFKKK